jgi:hypothetical protein
MSVKTDTDLRDADLRERFRELREQDGTATPALDNVLLRAGAQAQRGKPRAAWMAGGFAAVVMIGLVLFLRPPVPSPIAEAAAMPAWPRHTDFLLAGASDSSQRLNWSPSPTSGLGQPTFSHHRESR